MGAGGTLWGTLVATVPSRGYHPPLESQKRIQGAFIWERSVYTLENRGRELYNLKDDPAETKNLVEAEPRRAGELERKLFAHFRSLGHDLTGKRWEVGLNPLYPSHGRDAPKK